MKKLLVFGASSSKQSINKQLAVYAARKLKQASLTIVDLNDYEMPLFSVDKEATIGSPELAQQFKALIIDADGIIVSFAEHNGAYSTAYKNVLDWVSRLEKPIWSNKPMLVLATSPGKRGGASVLQLALGALPHQGAEVVASFSLPLFKENFSESGLSANFEEELTTAVAQFEKALN